MVRGLYFREAPPIKINFSLFTQDRLGESFLSWDKILKK